MSPDRVSRGGVGGEAVSEGGGLGEGGGGGEEDETPCSSGFVSRSFERHGGCGGRLVVCVPHGSRSRPTPTQTLETERMLLRCFFPLFGTKGQRTCSMRVRERT